MRVRRRAAARRPILVNSWRQPIGISGSNTRRLQSIGQDGAIGKIMEVAGRRCPAQGDGMTWPRALWHGTFDAPPSPIIVCRPEHRIGML